MNHQDHATPRPKPRWEHWVRSIGCPVFLAGFVFFVHSILLLFLGMDHPSSWQTTETYGSIILPLGLLLWYIGAVLMLISAYPGSPVWGGPMLPKWIALPVYALSWVFVPIVPIALMVTASHVHIAAITTAAHTAQIPLASVVWQALIFGSALAFFGYTYTLARGMVFPASISETRLLGQVLSQRGLAQRWQLWVGGTGLILIIACLIASAIIEKTSGGESLGVVIVTVIGSVGFGLLLLLVNPYIQQIDPRLEEMRMYGSYPVLYFAFIGWVIATVLVLSAYSRWAITMMLTCASIGVLSAVWLHIQIIRQGGFQWRQLELSQEPTA